MMIPKTKLLRCLPASILLVCSTAAAQEPSSRAEPLFLDGATQAIIPFHMNGGHVVLDVEINGSLLHLTLDNGVLWDQLLLYGGPRVDAVEMDRMEPPPADPQASGGPAPMESASGLTLRLPSVELWDQDAYITPTSANFARYFPGEDGLISGTLFSHYIVEIDFENEVLTLSSPKDYEYQGEGQTFELQAFEAGGYTLACTLEMGAEGSFETHPLLDLGGARALLVFQGACPDLPLPDHSQPANMGVGWNGHVGRVPALSFGKFRFKSVPVGYTDAVGKLGPKCEGLIGPALFARFKCTFDYKRKRMFLEPNAFFDAPFQGNFTGWKGKSRPAKRD